MGAEPRAGPADGRGVAVGVRRPRVAPGARRTLRPVDARLRAGSPARGPATRPARGASCGPGRAAHGRYDPAVTSADGQRGTEQRRTVLVYSDDRDVRAQVRRSLGRRPAAGLPLVEYVECATEPVVIARMDAGGIDLAVLEGEAVPAGGLGIC